MDHHPILRELRDLGPLDEEQIINGPRLAHQTDAAFRVDHTLPRLVSAGLISEKDGVYTITQAGRDWLVSH